MKTGTNNKKKPVCSLIDIGREMYRSDRTYEMICIDGTNNDLTSVAQLCRLIDP